MAKNFVQNTSSDPMHVLAAALLGGDTSAAIEAQEAAGQRELAASEVLPSDIQPKDREILTKAGVVFGDQVQGDEIFTHVTLPEGWKIVPTDHSMWSNLVDSKGRKRAMIFYKAAFYDRSAFLRGCRRYSADVQYEDPKNYRSRTRGYVTDGQTGPHLFEGSWHEYKKGVLDPAHEDAAVWLNEHFPLWDDLGAYWDQP